MGSRKRRQLKIILAIAFAVALVMGPGPGIYLINPDADAAAPKLVLGMPVVYAWTAFWFGVQVLVVLLSYFLVWRRTES